MVDNKVDIHCHILPNIDDGPATLEESLELVIQGSHQGVRTFIATPHFIPGEIEYEPEEVFKRVQLLQDAADQAGVLCKIYPGMELYLEPRIIQYIQKGQVIPLGGDSKYLLVEFPQTSLSMDLISLLHEISIRGYVPVIAHPERNIKMIEDPNLVHILLENRALLQVNASSIIGDNGKKVQKIVNDFIRNGLISFVSSDAHSVRRRAYHLEEAYQALYHRYSGSIDKYFSHNAKKVLENVPISREKNHLKPQRRGFFQSIAQLIR